MTAWELLDSVVPLLTFQPVRHVQLPLKHVHLPLCWYESLMHCKNQRGNRWTWACWVSAAQHSNVLLSNLMLNWSSLQSKVTFAVTLSRTGGVRYIEPAVRYLPWSKWGNGCVGHSCLRTVAVKLIYWQKLADLNWKAQQIKYLVA
jgi:hypothetical protein